MSDIKKRRIIYNDDSDSRRSEAAKGGKEAFLAERFNWTLDSQVDSYFWCIGNGMSPAFGVPDPAGLGDADQMMLDAAHGAGMEIFASLRMNDTHDSVFRQFLAPIKLERPDLLCAEDLKYPRDSILHLTWSAFDYAKEEVRKMRLDFIEYNCSKYDWDGFEMDFCRFRRYFRIGDEEKNAHIMTDFVGQVRAMLNKIGMKRGRPYLLAVRAPENIHYSNRLGLDIVKWVSNGWIDLIIAGDGLKPFSFPLKELIDLGHRFGLPVYSCISMAQFEPDNTGDDRMLERVRAAVSNRWLENPDGIYFFNLCCMMNSRNPVLAAELRKLLFEIGTPETLRGLDKVYESESVPHWADWQINSPPNLLPARLIDDVPLPMFVGDPIEGAMVSGSIKDITLRVRITGIKDEENVEVRLNGAAVGVVGRMTVEGMSIGAFDHSRGTWFDAPITSVILKQGYNEVNVRPSTGSWGCMSTMVAEVQLVVNYLRDEKSA